MTRLVWLALIVFLAACDGRAPRVSDPYDAAKMDFKSPPARVTQRAATGAPSPRAARCRRRRALKPLDPAPVKEIRLDTTHKIIEIAPA